MGTSAIQHNIPSMNAYRNYSANGSRLSKNLERLASGYKINRAGDDAAGLAISEKMRAQISGLTAAEKNAKDGISLIQTAEGALTEVHDMLNRMVTLAEQSANGTYQDELDREQLQKEMGQLKEEINRIADSTNFNGQKLLDGSLATKSSAFTIDSSEINSTTGANNPNMVDGITINAPTDGSGEKQTYSMKFDAGTLFGDGDKITFGVKDVSTSSVPNLDVTYKASNPANHNEFNGDTLEDQLNNIAKALNFQDTTATLGAASNGAAYNAGYEASVKMNDDGSGELILTAKDAGAPGHMIDSATVTDTQASTTFTQTTEGDAGTITAMDKEGWNLLGGGGHPLYVNSGDKLTFEFNINGTTMYAQIEEGEDFFLDATDTVANKTTKIVEALSNAKFLNPSEGDQIVAGGTIAGTSTTFTAITTAAAGTAQGALGSANAVETPTMDESNMRVGDFFDFTANVSQDGSTPTDGAIYAKQHDTANGKVNVGSAYLTNAGGSTLKLAAATVTGHVAGIVADDAAEVNKFTLDGTQNMSVGEKFVVKGQLKDGRDFEIELTAVKNGTTDLGENEFAIGATNDAAGQGQTTAAIKAALESEDNKVTVTNADGTTEEISAKALFGGAANNSDFSVAASGADITITNADKGAAGTPGIAAGIDTTNTGVVAGDQISTTLQNPSVGSGQKAAENLITFDPAKIEQGTSLVIDGKTYEFVSDAKFTTNENNVAVVVSNLGEDGVTGEDLANALKSVLDNDTADDGIYKSAGGGNYSLNVDGNKLTIKSEDIGSDVKALDVAMGANKASSVLTISTTDAGTLDDPTKTVASVKAGDTVTIGGKVYEFTEGKGASNADHTAVSLLDDNGNKMTSADAVAQRLADVVNDTAGSGSDTEAGIVARADGGKVIFTGKYNALADAKGKNAYAAPDVKLTGNGGLTLQIGDTSDSYNKLTVSVNDMHTDAMGIADVDISTQEGAAAALDKIKSAVNYVSDVRGSLGAMQNRLDHTINNLGVMKENIQSAESLIRDTDVAEEMMNYTKNNILNQSAQAMLAQANQLPQGVLQLLG